LSITGKGGKERTTPLHLESVERLTTWLAHPGIADDPAAPMFPAAMTPRGLGRDGFRAEAISIRGVEKLIERYVAILRLDPNVTVHSLPHHGTRARVRHHRFAGFCGACGPTDDSHLHPLEGTAQQEPRLRAQILISLVTVSFRAHLSGSTIIDGCYVHRS
jgi:hypothetical protein